MSPLNFWEISLRAASQCHLQLCGRHSFSVSLMFQRSKYSPRFCQNINLTQIHFYKIYQTMTSCIYFLFVSAFVVCGFICISLYFPRFRLHLRVSHFAERGVAVFIEHSAQLNFSSNKNPIYLLSTNMISPPTKYNQRLSSQKAKYFTTIHNFYEAGKPYQLNFPSSMLAFTTIILMMIMMVNPESHSAQGWH